jgi:hypothetical protein
VGGKYQHGWGALLYKLGKHATLPQATTQNTTTTHNNQHELPPPYPPVALPSIDMAISVMAPDLGAATLYGSVACAGRPVHSRCGRLPCFRCQNRTHKKIERYAGLWPLMDVVWGCKTTINPMVGVSLGGGVLERRQEGVGVHGGMPSHCLDRRIDRQKKSKYTLALETAD